MHPNALRNLLPKSGPRYGKGILWHIAILMIEIFRRRFKRCNSVIGQGTTWLCHNSASCHCQDSRVILRLTFEKWLKPLEICLLVYFLRFHLKAWKKSIYCSLFALLRISKLSFIFDWTGLLSLFLSECDISLSLTFCCCIRQTVLFPLPSIAFLLIFCGLTQVIVYFSGSWNGVYMALSLLS